MKNSFETAGLDNLREEDVEVVESEKIEERDPTKEEAERALKELEERMKEIEKRKN